MRNKSSKIDLAVFVATLIAAILFVSVRFEVANAASDPAINPGTKPNFNAAIVKGIDKNSSLSMNESLYLTANNQNGETSTSNYGLWNNQDKHNSSTIDQNQFQDLTLHFSFTNTSADDPQYINEILLLPKFLNPGTNVLYGNASTVQPTTGSYTTGMKATYSWGNGDYFENKPADKDWSQLIAIQIRGNLPKGKTYGIDINLNVGNFTPASTKSFGFQVFSYSLQNGVRKSDVVGYATFGKKVAGPSSTAHMIATTKSNNTYTMNPELQKIMPTTSSNLKSASNPNGAVEENLAGDAQRPDNYFYNSDQKIVTLANIVGQDGKTKLADIIHHKGYSFDLKDGKEFPNYIYSGGISSSSFVMPDNKTPIIPGKTTYEDQQLDSLYLEFQKIIDAKDSVLAKGTVWDPYANASFLNKDYQKIVVPNSNVSYVVKRVDNDGHETPTANNQIDTSNDATYFVTYADKISESLTVYKTVKVTVGTGKVPTANPNNSSGNSESNTVDPTNNGGNTSTGDSTSEVIPPAQPPKNNGLVTSPEHKYAKNTVIYGIKKIYLYKNATFNKSKRIAKYNKAKRVNRPLFIVTGYAYSKGGVLRYRVQDINHGTKTDKLRGYVTANKSYIAKAYYSTLPKHNKIMVISPKGINAYKQTSLKKKVKNYKKGQLLTVKKLIRHNLTSRYQLKNGTYVTANKRLVIQVNH